MKTVKEQKVYKTNTGDENTYPGYRLDKKAYVRFDAMLHLLIFEKKNPFTKRQIKDMGKETALELIHVIGDWKDNYEELGKLVLDLKNEYIIID